MVRLVRSNTLNPLNVTMPEGQRRIFYDFLYSTVYTNTVYGNRKLVQQMSLAVILILQSLCKTI